MKWLLRVEQHNLPGQLLADVAVEQPSEVWFMTKGMDIFQRDLISEQGWDASIGYQNINLNLIWWKKDLLRMLIMGQIKYQMIWKKQKDKHQDHWF